LLAVVVEVSTEVLQAEATVVAVVQVVFYTPHQQQ
jgi:hypothetical protein